MFLKPKLLFVYDHQYPDLWQDGLWAALKVLEADFDITWQNLHGWDCAGWTPKGYDFLLCWGAFGSRPDILGQDHLIKHFKVKSGLCIAGNAFAPTGADNYDILFYETKWYRPQIDFHPNIVQAFGVNTDIYQPYAPNRWTWDWLTVGAFANWKRQTKILDKPGTKLAVGEIQRGNQDESFAIINQLLQGGCGVSGMVPAPILAQLYNQARTVYIPADINGGGERAVLEARACGARVEVEPDNPKLLELVSLEQIPSHHDYTAALKKGILSCL